MSIDLVISKLSVEERRDLLAGLYARTVKGRVELLKGGLSEVMKAGMMVRKGMGVNAALMCEEFGAIIADSLNLRLGR